MISTKMLRAHNGKGVHVGSSGGCRTGSCHTGCGRTALGRHRRARPPAPARTQTPRLPQDDALWARTAPGRAAVRDQGPNRETVRLCHSNMQSTHPLRPLQRQTPKLAWLGLGQPSLHATQIDRRVNAEHNSKLGPHLTASTSFNGIRNRQ